MKIFLSIILVLILFSCQNEKKKKHLNQKKIESIQKENKPEIESIKLANKEKTIDLDTEVERNIIICENNKFIIKIDYLKNEDIRYISWNKPKLRSDKPDLVIYDGEAKRKGTMGGYNFLFKNEQWQYVIEQNIMGEDESLGIFLKLFKNGKQMLNTKMTSLK